MYVQLACTQIVRNENMRTYVHVYVYMPQASVFLKKGVRIVWVACECLVIVERSASLPFHHCTTLCSPKQSYDSDEGNHRHLE